jgi:Cu2+-exporting ATPase
MELVESLSVTKTPLVELANRVSGYFLRLVLLLAAVTLIFWWPAGPDKALEHTIALLIVACPCALGLATPLTIAVAQGRAARRSILIRCGEVFERLNRPGAIWLDKTGTVTQGQMVVQAWYGRRDIIPHVLSLERKVIHPLADCLVRALEHEVPSANRLSVQELVYQPGLGVRGLVEGKRICIGSKDFLRNLQINMSPESNWPIGQMIAQGWTPLCIGCDGQLAAVVAVGDSIRPDAATAVKRLRALHRNVGLLSGDNPDIVRQVASQLDIPPDWTKGAMLPEDKLALVREAPLGSNVVMVGDGVNDAAALAAASVGVAVHGGAEASLLAAPVYLGRPGLEPLVELIEGSRRVLWAVRIGLFVSLSYNLFAISLAVGGQITPLLAAVLMPISSLSVTLLAILQRTFRSSP